MEGFRSAPSVLHLSFAVVQVPHRLQRQSALVWVLGGLQETPALPRSSLSCGPGFPFAACCSFLFPLPLPAWWFCPCLSTSSLRQHQLAEGLSTLGWLELAGSGTGQPMPLLTPAVPRDPNPATAEYTQPGMA